MTRTQETAERFTRDVHWIVVGQDETIRLAFVALVQGGHLLIEGVPGTAKTLLARTIARLIGGSFKRIQFTPDLMPSDIVGTSVYEINTSSFRIKEGPIFANVVLADEVNRAPAKAQAALLEAMEEHQVTLEGEARLLPRPFLVLATQNPVEYEGTYPLPEAELDRFLFKAIVRYPEATEERAILRAHDRGQPLEQPRRVRRARGARDPEEDVHSPGFSLLVRALGRFEEDGELVQARGSERFEGRHGRARVDAGRALQVVDLELDAEISRPDGRQRGGTAACAGRRPSPGRETRPFQAPRSAPEAPPQAADARPGHGAS